jgi:hypothetical protein
MISLSLLTTPHPLSLFLLTTSSPVAVCTSPQHPAYSHISISHVSLLSLSQFVTG